MKSLPCWGFVRNKDGCEVQPGDNITLQADGTLRRLIIRSAEISDAGSYSCQSGNNNVEFTVNVRGTTDLCTKCSQGGARSCIFLKTEQIVLFIYIFTYF